MFPETPTRISLAALLALTGLACGAGEDELTDEDLAAVSEVIVGSATAAKPAARSTGIEEPITVTQAVNTTTACPGGGHIVTTGNFYVTCPNPPATGECTLTGMLHCGYGDRTNNLNDCGAGNGLYFDGGVNFIFSGKGQSLKLTVNGTIEIARKGPTGGLIPLGGCNVLLTASTDTHILSGFVCHHSVQARF